MSRLSEHPLRAVIALVAMAVLFPLSAHAEADTVGVFCPMDFDEVFDQGYLAHQFSEAIDSRTTLAASDMERMVEDAMLSGKYYGDLLDVVLLLAKERGYKKVVILTFEGDDSFFMMLDPKEPDLMLELSTTLPPKMSDQQFSDLMHQVTDNLLQSYISAESRHLPVNYTSVFSFRNPMQ